jgi:hypothetical protein
LTKNESIPVKGCLVRDFEYYTEGFQLFISFEKLIVIFLAEAEKHFKRVGIIFNKKNMNLKFENLNDQLFKNEQIDKNQMSKVIGGDEGQCPSDVSRNTYVLQGGDHVNGTDVGYFENVKWERKVQDGWIS